jgi:4-amino-4-deoxy-L-arabinose transferase-like glycosyltransferase
MSKTQKIIFILIISLAAFLRLYGLNWDSGQHLHPDERFLTMVANDIKLPSSISQYFNPSNSPLNPANAGYDFFVYGTFPLFLVKFLAIFTGMDNYGGITLLGRLICALFDTGTVFLVYLIAKDLSLKSQAPSTKLQINPKHQVPNYKRFGILNFKNWSLFDNWNLGFGILPILASFFYAVSVLPIQLSHFFTVDTFLVFFITLSFYLLLKFIKHISVRSELRVTCYVLRVTAALGAAFGLALSSKISALLFLPIIILGLLLSHQAPYVRWLMRNFLVSTFIVLTTAYITFRIFNPYAFSSSNILNPTIAPQFIQNLKTLKSFDNAQAAFPPAIQWIKTKSIIFPLRNMLYYGLGLPLGLLAIGGFFYTIYLITKTVVMPFMASKNAKSSIHDAMNRITTNPISALILMLIWVIGLFLFQSLQFAKPLRYFAPIYPFLAILAAVFFTKILTANKKTPISRGFFGVGKELYPHPADTSTLTIHQLIKLVKSKLRRAGDLHSTPAQTGAHLVSARASTSLVHSPLTIMIAYFILIFIVSLWPLAFISIYSRPHSRVLASRWIYENIPAGSTLTCETWDDCLPLPLPDQSQSKYNIIQLPLYDLDTPEKWEKINAQLKKADYLILSSNRLYGSITSVPERYPKTNKFYQQLFSSANNNSWVKKVEFTSRPHLPLPFFNSQLSTLNFCISPPFEWYGKIAEQSRALNNRKARLLIPGCKGLTVVDDYADESFTVYDHPKVIIFKKKP